MIVVLVVNRVSPKRIDKHVFHSLLQASNDDLANYANAIELLFEMIWIHKLAGAFDENSLLCDKSYVDLFWTC